MTKTYGIDDSKTPTPLMVRDAIVECFFKAHCEASSLSDDESINRAYCQENVKKAFASTGGDFDKPTKESIMKAMEGLAEFAKGFRNQTVIKKHYGEIMKLVEKLK